jgi:Na+/H+ antiporter NhaD/arsenite permease-like protein
MKIFGTNIGATILLSRILQTWLQSSPSPRVRDASILALALGSNYGAFTFSFPASLAGLLWRRLLADKGIVVTMGQFAKLNLMPVACAMGISSLVVIGQVYIFDKG